MNINYLSPDFYKATEDGVKLASFVSQAKKVQEELFRASSIAIYDIGCGNGVIGFEWILKAFADGLTSSKNIVLYSYDLQEDYRDYWLANKERVEEVIGCALVAHFIVDDWKNISWEIDHADAKILLANPPYYDVTKNRLSVNAQRCVAKFWSLEQAKFFLGTIERAQKSGFNCCFLWGHEFMRLLDEQSQERWERHQLNSHVSLVSSW